CGRHSYASPSVRHERHSKATRCRVGHRSLRTLASEITLEAPRPKFQCNRSENVLESESTFCSLTQIRLVSSAKFSAIDESEFLGYPVFLDQFLHFPEKLTPKPFVLRNNKRLLIFAPSYLLRQQRLHSTPKNPLRPTITKLVFSGEWD